MGKLYITYIDNAGTREIVDLSLCEKSIMWELLSGRGERVDTNQIVRKWVTLAYRTREHNPEIWTFESDRSLTFLLSVAAKQPAEFANAVRTDGTLVFSTLTTKRNVV